MAERERFEPSGPFESPFLVNQHDWSVLIWEYTRRYSLGLDHFESLSCATEDHMNEPLGQSRPKGTRRSPCGE